MHIIGCMCDYNCQIIKKEKDFRIEEMYKSR